ncbi:hypothetical protein I4U23_015523 [Adineta vaga]|nr:hypothetical protein I4U23_015523 [Adineta vaga]
MMIDKLPFIWLIIYVSVADGSHFRGGSITWRPSNRTPSGSAVSIIVTERFSWRLSSTACNAITIAAQTSKIGNYDSVLCVSGNCSFWSSLNTQTFCTDFDVNLDVASGEYYQTYNLPVNISFGIAYSSCCWFANIVRGGGNMAIGSKISTVIRPDGYINTSPIAVSLPIIYKKVGEQHVHVVQMSDFDGTDKLRCRWSNGSAANINGFDECGGLCNGVSGANLTQATCTITFTLTNSNMYVGVALQIEDFYNDAAVVANTPMSSVPIQFLFYGYNAPIGCSTPPVIIGNRRNKARVAVMSGVNITETVVAKVMCSGKTIVNFISSLPIGMIKSNIQNRSTDIYTMTLKWVPLLSQTGPQVVCMGAVDNTQVQSNQWCVTFVVGSVAPNIIQSSARPNGIILQNQSIFTIRTTSPVRRPLENDTYIYFWDATLGGTLVRKYDCAWEPQITYNNFTIAIHFSPVPWILGHSYYVTFDSGVATDTTFWGLESASITDPTFWFFNVSTSILPPLSSDHTTFSELYIPARTLLYGLYEIKLTVNMINLTNLSSSATVYVRITASGITANLIQFGTSMITRGNRQDLQLDPGNYSIDPDQNTFNASNWKYKYYCRIYGLSLFPNLQGSLLTVDDIRNDSSNPSCLFNRTGWKFDNSINSSLTILSDSLRSNQTYQFMVYMENRYNSSLQATGYVLVKVEDTRPYMILIGCVISTLCQPNLEFHLVNPTTQVALFSVCNGNCSTIQHITWNVYHSTINSTSNFTQWTILNQTTSYQNRWFFGTNTSNFTATNQLFSSNPHIYLWRFEVVYIFSNETGSSSFNFFINQPLSNGSCSINPLNGTTTSLFTISCSNWFAEDEIRDYALYIRTNDPKKKMILGYSAVSTFQVRLPPGDNQTALVHLTVHIRDTLNCITEFDLSPVLVVSDMTTITNLINDIHSTSDRTMTNGINQLLTSENQNIVGQLITSLSFIFNQWHYQMIEKAVSNGIPAVTIYISSFDTRSFQQLSMSWNQSAFVEYQKELNSHATIRDYLITFMKRFLITTSNSIKLQASSLAQLTKATNELTRVALIIASDRCYQLGIALDSMRTKIPYEDAQFVAGDLLQCASNLISAVNGPLQQRTTILDLDSSRATTLPDDYDTDLELDWANPHLFADGDDFSWETIQKNRNIYYQKHLAYQISIQMNKLISLLTSTLNIHMNIGQNFSIETSQVLMTLETVSSQSLSNSSTKQIGNSQIHLPSNGTVDLNKSEKISIRSILMPLAEFGNSSLSSNTNLSRSISFSFLDHNQEEIPIETTMNKSIEIIIPRDPNLIVSPMILQNATLMNMAPHHLSFHYQYFNLTTSLPMSVHWNIQPLNVSVAYLIIYRFDQIPQLNSSINQIDGWTLLCPSILTNESVYTFYIDNQHTVGHQAVIFGVRELNATEMNERCSNSSITNPPITNERYNFTSNYQFRVYTSGCYYLDKNNRWKSDGLLVGSFGVLPETVDWSYVFANADFTKNLTVYLTVICVCVIYIILIIYARYYDKKDVEKLGVTVLPDNHKEDQYFYQIIVFTGQRTNAGTNSNVHFVIHGNDNDTRIRTFTDSHRRILQRGGVDAFLMSVPKSLGLLNCIRIWHDNSGKGSSSSWFLKYLIIRDLQTMDKYHFICQRWLAVEKDDGKIERVLSVASELEKRQFSFVLAKQTYHSVSDGHLWFSIFSRPPSNRFTRVQRCTCCFVLLFLSMFLNIMYYDLSNEDKSTKSTSMSFGSLYITPQQIIIGMIVELFALIPSLFLVQLFRRLRPRQKQQSSIRQALYKLKSLPQDSLGKKNVKSPFIFPWWCIFIAYGLCMLIIGLSILFIIARGIEFGDEKVQKWLASILSGFFSSILLTEPLKIISLAIFFAYFCRKSDDNKEAIELLDDDQVILNHDEEYLHTTEVNLKTSPIRTHRLNESEVNRLRHLRTKEIQMWSVIREVSLYLCFLSLLCVVIYSNRDSNAFLQVNHLRKYFLNSRQIDLDYTKVTTIQQYWNWLENSFVDNLRAQEWYNGEAPRNLSGFIDDKSNRLIGWATMRQLRVKSKTCQTRNPIFSMCQGDYNLLNNDEDSYAPGWKNETLQIYSSFIQQAFTYQSADTLDTYIRAGDHSTYSGGGYVYEFRGRISDLRSNLSQLHQLGWIDNQTRAVMIQLTLYNPNVQLFTAVTLLAEFISSSGIFTSVRFEPISFYEIRLLYELKWKYFQRFWSYVEVGIIVCSWTSVGIYIWRYHECQRIGQLFKETNGYVYINLQLASYINDILIYLLSFCIKKAPGIGIQAERNVTVPEEYCESVERFPEKIDQLLNALNQIYMDQTKQTSIL